MSELRRWSEEGATPAELSLLEVSRREHAPAQARARALGALGIAVALSTVTATTAAATSRSVGVLLKVLGVSLVGGGLVAGGLAVRRAHQATAAMATVSQPRAVSSTSTAITTPVTSELPEAAPSAAASAGAEAATSAAPVAASSVSSRPARPEAAAGRLSREVAALELAHQALAAHNPSSALNLLDRYRAEFPSGALGSEATVLRVQALLAGGNRGAAQALADSYSSAHPDSPYARRIQDTLHSGR